MQILPTIGLASSSSVLNLHQNLKYVHTSAYKVVGVNFKALLISVSVCGQVVPVCSVNPAPTMPPKKWGILIMVQHFLDQSIIAVEGEMCVLVQGEIVKLDVIQSQHRHKLASPSVCLPPQLSYFFCSKQDIAGRANIISRGRQKHLKQDLASPSCPS